jgi:hemerythrin superfamily protein
MITQVPDSLKKEHEHLHAELSKATRESGALGESAREVARLLHAHFVKEEQYAMPPLGLLSKLSEGTVTADMGAILPLTRLLKAELPAMLAEHKEIVAALQRFRARAQEAGRTDYERFADALALHAQNEEEVLYPAALLVGDYVAMKLRQTEGT